MFLPEQHILEILYPCLCPGKQHTCEARPNGAWYATPMMNDGKIWFINTVGGLK